MSTITTIEGTQIYDKVARRGDPETPGSSMSELSKIANKADLANLRSSAKEQMKIPDLPKAILYRWLPTLLRDMKFAFYV
jgi:hypothetical protein